MSRLLIKYAARGRFGLFVETINNILTTTTGEYTLVISVDEDDKVLNCPEIKEFLKQKNITNVFWSHSKNKIHAINRDMEKFTDWDWLVVMSDDMKFIKNGWNEIMLMQIKERWPKGTDWFAHFNDGFVHDKLPTMSVMGKEYYDRTGNIYEPSYGSFSCDAEALYVSQMLGKYHYFEECVFKHYHPANTPNVRNDEMYVRANAWGGRDVENYWNRMKKLFYVNNPVFMPFDVADQLKKKFNITIQKSTKEHYEISDSNSND